ncbi:putative lipid-binding transport protein (Tim44 family) [Mycetocola sp. BIGb0189]|uniref:hypothetical protein n=1 Tax=Mycetocola sp. BIGb0189 TaxID=2940604 RepID=UPI0021699594|nr:hypothetical protein [Mycetocola sp. BIGb0189]MCS4277687.1 putative lipid-binding transport protein (Tim44 family) [Mycetocola sp. BIGb0189]
MTTPPRPPMTRATIIGIILVVASLAAGIVSTLSGDVTIKAIALGISFVALVGAGVVIGIQVAAERRKVSAARRAAAAERAAGDGSPQS